MARDFTERLAAAAPWATFNVHRGRDQPGLALEKFLLPDTAARLHAGYSDEPAAPPAHAAPAAPARPLKPAWAKSGAEIMAKLDLHQRIFAQHLQPGRVM
jgi:hypothetical protein